MSWSSLWAYFEAATSEIKADIWIQLDLINHLKGLDVSHQLEVLKSAPSDVLGLVKNHIYLDTAIKLGIKKNNVIRMVIR